MASFCFTDRSQARIRKNVCRPKFHESSVTEYTLGFEGFEDGTYSQS